jgi:hypothetical protein
MNEAWIRAMQIELQREALISLIVLVVLFAVFMFALYHVIKAAIRDGIQESGLVNVPPSAWTRAVQRADDLQTVPQMPERAER